MRLGGRVQQVWVYIGESDRWQGKPLYLAILEMLRRSGCSGATAVRGLAGFGANSLIHTATLVELSSDLPVVVTFVDTEERVARMLPEISAMVQEGLITRSEVEVVKYTHRSPGAFPEELTVADVMTRDVVSVRPETPVGDVVQAMAARGVRVVPVTEADGRLVGVLTDGDLLARGGVDLPIGLRWGGDAWSAKAIPPETPAARMRAADVMTRDPIAVQPELSLAAAAAVLARHHLTRVPVAGPEGRVVGVLSRSDLLRTVAETLPQRAAGTRPVANITGRAKDAMVADPATVNRSTPLADALDRLLEVADRRVIVVDDDRRPVGIVTDGDVLERAARRVRTGALRSLVAWFSGGARPERLEVAARRRNAADVMSSPVSSVGEDAPMSEVLRVMMSERVKLLPVVDAEGKLCGAISRAALLAALARGSASACQAGGEDGSEPEG